MNSWATKSLTTTVDEVANSRGAVEFSSRAKRIFGGPSALNTFKGGDTKKEKLDSFPSLSPDHRLKKEESTQSSPSGTSGMFLGKRKAPMLDPDFEESIMTEVGLKILANFEQPSDMNIRKQMQLEPSRSPSHLSESSFLGRIGSPEAPASTPMPQFELSENRHSKYQLNQAMADRNAREKQINLLLVENSREMKGTETSNYMFVQNKPTWIESLKSVDKSISFGDANLPINRESSKELFSSLNQDPKEKTLASPILRNHLCKEEPKSQAESINKITQEFKNRNQALPFKPLGQILKSDKREERGSKGNSSSQVIDSEMMFIKKLKLKSANDQKTEENCSTVQSLLTLLDKQPLDINHLTCLTHYEYLLFKALVKKLYGINTIEDATPEEFVKIINSNIFNGKPKRLEEELKIVFKKTLKHLMNLQKEKMDMETREPLKKMQYTVGFYKYYFEKTYNENPLFRDHFKIEDKEGRIDYSKLNSVLIHPLTVNAQHLSMVTLSPQFRDDLLGYLNNQIMEEYKKVRILKTKRILINFYDLAAKNPSKAAIDEFTSNHQMKLPWATRDLEHAITTFKNVLGRPSKQQIFSQALNDV